MASLQKAVKLVRLMMDTRVVPDSFRKQNLRDIVYREMETLESGKKSSRFFEMVVASISDFNASDEEIDTMIAEIKDKHIRANDPLTAHWKEYDLFGSCQEYENMYGRYEFSAFGELYFYPNVRNALMIEHKQSSNSSLGKFKSLSEAKKKQANTTIT